MRNALIIIADSHSSGINHKSVLPTVRYKYLKSEHKYMLIDLYKDNYDTSSDFKAKPDNLTRSYMHCLKTATEVHIITSAHLGGVSNKLEGFLELVMKEGFAFNIKSKQIKSRFDKKDLFVYVFHKDNYHWFNPVWFRFKFTISKLFKSTKITQYNYTGIAKNGRPEFLKRLNKKLTKWLF